MNRYRVIKMQLWSHFANKSLLLSKALPINFSEKNLFFISFLLNDSRYFTLGIGFLSNPCTLEILTSCSIYPV